MYDLPTAPGALLGHTKTGRPIYLAAGGSEDGDSGSTDTGATDDAETTDTDDDGQTDDTGSSSNDGQSEKPNTTGGDGDTKAQIARLEKQLADARAERGKERVNAKKQAADEAVGELTKKLGKALGLVQDEKDEAPDPKALADQLAAKDRAHREATVELGIFRSAGKHGADANALTDSREFMAKVTKLDPTADDFNTKLSDAVKKAVADNPTRYKTAGQAPATSGGEITGGSGERQKKSDDDLSVEEHMSARAKARGFKN